MSDDLIYIAISLWSSLGWFYFGELGFVERVRCNDGKSKAPTADMAAHMEVSGERISWPYASESSLRSDVVEMPFLSSKAAKN